MNRAVPAPASRPRRSRFAAATLMLLSLMVRPASAWDLFASFSQGYTHYRAEDLNRVLVLLESTTQLQGFNNYQVSRFDGHPQKALVLGWRNGPWRLGVETEFWVEEFRQLEVPFDVENQARDYRISCADLRARDRTQGSLYGCVDARESFTFLPITAQVSYGLDLGRSFRVEAGYGLGVMAGSASIDLRTEYFGQGAKPDDHIRFDVWPGVNPVQKVFADFEYLPFRWLGLTARAGWRFSRLRDFELRGQEGDSEVFKTLFPNAANGARLYIESPPGDVEPYLFIGNAEQARLAAQETGHGFHLVEGDFTGWFASLKLNLHWRDL